MTYTGPSSASTSVTANTTPTATAPITVTEPLTSTASMTTTAAVTSTSISTQTGPLPSNFAVGLALIAEGLTAPVVLVSPPDDSGRLIVVDQVGIIHLITAEGQLQAEPFLDIRNQMVALQGRYDERGLLGLAFYPDYANNGRFVVYYSAPLRAEAPGNNHNSLALCIHVKNGIMDSPATDLRPARQLTKHKATQIYSS